MDNSLGKIAQPRVNRISREDIRHNRSDIKRIIGRKSLIEYFLTDFLTIKNFSKASNIIRFRFFIFMALNPAVIDRFSGQIQQSLAKTLCQSLSPIIRNGWRSLGKLTYNKLLFLYDFVFSLKELDLQLFEENPGKILETLYELESAFYILYSDAGLLPMLQRELEQYFRVTKNKDFPVDFLIRNIEMLLSQSTRSLTLHSFFIAINCIYYRRYCSVDTLINGNAGPFFYDDDFELDDSTRKQLKDYSDTLVSSIKMNMDIYQDVALLRTFIPVRGHLGKSDIDALEIFYNSAGDELPDDRFVSDHSNTLAFIVNFSRKVNIEFKRILTENIPLHGNKKARIFDASLFSNYLRRADFIKKKLDTAMRESPLLRRDHYLKALAEGGTVEETRHLCASITELLSIYFYIARVLANILKYSSRSPKSESLPAIRSIEFKNTRFFIPFEDTVQFSSSFLSGKTVRESLSVITKVLFVLCLDMREANLLSTISKDRNVTNSLKHLTRELQRISSAERFAALRRQLGISDEVLSHEGQHDKS